MSHLGTATDAEIFGFDDKKGAVVATLEVSLVHTTESTKNWTEAVRVFLFKSMFTNLCGVTASDWLKIVGRHGLSIEPKYWQRAAVVSLGSVLNSWYKWREDRSFGAQLEQTEIEPPIFILGHWRSGTTLLHNLLALDDRFAFPNLYEVFFPHTFLGTEDQRTGLAAPLIPTTRAFDNVAQRLDMPNEDEFATAAASLLSPYMSWAFPKATKYYERFLTFRDVPAADRLRWEASLVTFLKKLTLRHQRPLLLKSPPHTGRLSLLANLFPEAKFVHVYRDPFSVFQSTRHMSRIFTECLQFQKADPNDLDAGVLRRYKMMHDSYFDERGSIADGRLHELAFESLEIDPIAEMRKIYESLGLSSFDEQLPKLEDYVRSLASYRKNRYVNLDEDLKREIRSQWGRSFDAWGYSEE